MDGTGTAGRNTGADLGNGATPDEATLRAEARAWYEANWDPALPTGEWFRRLMTDRWGYPGWPRRWWGRDLPVQIGRAHV